MIEEKQQHKISNRSNPIKIRTYCISTKKMRTYPSVYAFLKENGYTYKLNLSKIRNGEIIKTNDHYISKKAKGVPPLLTTINKKIKDQEKEKRLNLVDNLKLENEKIFNSAVLILDKNLTIKEIFIGTLVELAKKKGIGIETLKSRLCRFRRVQKNFYKNGFLSSKNDEHFCYIKDYLVV